MHRFSIANLLLLTTLPGMVSAQTFAPIPPPPRGSTIPYTMPESAGAARSPTRFVESEDSPELIYAEVVMRLQETRDKEASGTVATQLREQWQRLLRQKGAEPADILKAQSRYLTQYESDLKDAVESYKSIVDALESIRNKVPGKAVSVDPTVEQALAEMGELDRQVSLKETACHLDPDSCIPPDPAIMDLMEQVGTLVDQLGGTSPTRSIDPEGLLKQTRLLYLRAELMRKVIRDEAFRIITESTAPTRADGTFVALPGATAQIKNRPITKKPYRPGDPMRD